VSVPTEFQCVLRYLPVHGSVSPHSAFLGIQEFPGQGFREQKQIVCLSCDEMLHRNVFAASLHSAQPTRPVRSHGRPHLLMPSVVPELSKMFPCPFGNLVPQGVRISDLALTHPTPRF
jgi:hypothetical protein